MRVALCLLLAGCQAAPPVRLESEAADVLAEVRAAIGASDLFGARDGMTFFGTRVAPAVDVDAQSEGGTDLAERPMTLSFRPSGPFLLTVGDGVGETARGFDGQEAWVEDGRDVVRRQALGGRAHLVADGWLRSLLWLVPGYDRFVVTVDEERSTPEEIVLDLEHPDEPLRATVRIDRTTRRPASYEIERMGRTRTVEFRGWQAGEGNAVFPAEMVESLDGERLHVDRFVRGSRGTPRSFAPPRSQPTDVTFTATGPGGALGSALGDDARVDRGGRFYVRVSIDGRDDVWMLLDTGFGSHALEPGLADELGLSRTGRASLSGVGGGGRSAWRAARTLTVGPLTLTRPRFVEFDASFLSERAGFPVQGVLGAPLFERAVVVLDDRRGTVDVHDPSRYRSRGLEWQPMLIDGTAPCVRGRLLTDVGETPQLWLRLDTGSDDTLTVARWAVKEYGLAGDRTTLSPRSLVGPFGVVLGWRKTALALEVAGAILRREEITLLRESVPGPLSDPWIAGNVGTRTLQSRRVVIDLPRRRIWIGPHE